MTSSDDKNFAPQEREQHKKERRVHNSLGALLLGLGGKTGNQNDKSESETTGSNTNNSNNGNNSNSGQRQSENSVSRKRMNGKMDTTDEPYTSTKADFGWSAAAADMEGPSSSDAVEQQQQEEEQRQQQPNDNANKRRRMDVSYGNELEHWGETKKFEDDFDPEWLAYQHKELDKKYGEGIITVKYTEHGTLGYYCELCFAVMNAIKPLEMHCSGMKHLKKKDIYDKSKASGGTMLMERAKTVDAPHASSTSRGRSDSHASSSSHGRSDLASRGRSDLASRGRSDLEPPSRFSKEGNYDRDRYGREDYYDRDRYSRDGARDPYARGGYDYGSRSGGRERDYGRDPYGRGRDRYEGADRFDPYADRYYKDDLRNPYPDESRKSSDRLPPYSSDRPHSGEVSGQSADWPYAGSNSRHSADYWDDRRSHASDIVVKAPSPPPAIPAPPPITSTPPVETDTSLAGGPAAALLTKLAQCTVKNENDAELASSVINLLLKSLKEYNYKLGEKSVADLMEQAEIKLGTAKAIRAVRKPDPVTNPLEAISLAMSTLRRANADKPSDYPSLGNVTSNFKRF